LRHSVYGFWYIAVDAVFMEFAKAFDKVPHQRLLRKLMSHRITAGKLFQ